MKIMTYDCGYAVMCVTRSRILFKFRMPFPLTLKSWRYLLRNRSWK